MGPEHQFKSIEVERDVIVERQPKLDAITAAKRLICNGRAWSDIGDACGRQAFREEKSRKGTTETRLASANDDFLSTESWLLW